ncbi:MAG TPA: sugar ABC transporter ATP-binding protein [Lachnospiraceae bacterium]|nr:sugar ABC transporter ATP-binding protein [Lachnospiraceae bacterium]
MKGKRNTLRRILIYIKPYSPAVILSMLCALVSTVLTLYVPILTGRAIDLIVYKEADLAGIVWLLTRAALCALIAGLSQWVMNVINNRTAFYTVRDIRNDAFDRLMRLPFSWLDSHSHGDTVSNMIADVDQLSDGLIMGFSQLFTGVITIAGTLGFMLRMNIRITLIVILVTPLSLFMARFISQHTFSMFKGQSEIRGEQTAFVNEMLGNIKVVKAFGREEETQKSFENVNEELRKASLRAVFYSSLTNPGTRFVNAVMYAMVALFGALNVLAGGMSVGTLTCFLSYANQYTKPFNEITGVITEFQNAVACAARIFKLIDEEPEVSDARLDRISDVSGRVDISEVDFSYDRSKTLIEDLNLCVKPGERVAIVGPTGCGKTTIINLLMRFYDTDAGSISVDGRDIRDITRNSLRSSYGMVLQDTWLRSGTIADNIRIGKKDASLEEIIAAARETRAHSFIRRLENGYDTYITEDGGQLSQGQKQLLCITRVMLSLPPMLILDEATSSIDIRTEKRIQDAFRKLMEGRTSFIVAHRLSTIRNADTILVMKNGKVIEQGSHEELLLRGGFYTELYNSQFEETDRPEKETGPV